MVLKQHRALQLFKYVARNSNVFFLTFARVSKEYYAPALGGIMLSIGIKLSFDDFALAFRRFLSPPILCYRAPINLSLQIPVIIMAYLLQTFTTICWIYCTICA